jgi:hypothetical protein
VRRLGAAAAALALAVGWAGCGGSDGGGGGGSNRADATPKLPGGAAPRSGTPAVPRARADSGKGVIQAWTMHLYKGRYRKASALFARNALVEQTVVLILHTRADALAFNRSLPCRAKVTRIEREADGRLLASFDLYAQSDGRCQGGGKARVRFLIRGGKIKEWRQLPEAPAPPSQST